MSHRHATMARASALALALTLTTSAWAIDLRIIVPAAPGGGWDQLGRGVQQTMQSAKLADKIQVTNAAGAGGTIGLAQLINNHKGDGNALMVSGKGMVSAIYINKSPVNLGNVTPIARLTGEYEVLVVPASSPLKSMATSSRRTRRIREASPGRAASRAGSINSPRA